jgi:DnaK suppressor protein
MSSRSHGLSERDRASLRKALEAKRAELVRAHGKDLSAGTHSDEGYADPMDAATRATDEHELLGMVKHQESLVAEIDRALAKMAHGTYGVSELSGEPIPIERLRAVPWARLTVEEEERRR